MPAQSQRVNVSMVSLKWGDVLSMLLPGAVALYAIAPYFPQLQERINEIFDHTGQSAPGTAFTLTLLIAAALIGGVLEALTRITWEKFWLVRRCPPKEVLQYLTPHNVELYERGVQASYKWVTFYANFAWAMILLFISRIQHLPNRCSLANFVILLSIVVLLIASHVQWTYYVNYQTKVIRPEEELNARKRSTEGDTDSIHKGSSEEEFKERRHT